MLDWDTVLQQLNFDYIDEPVDREFIVVLLQRYFPDRSTEELGATLTEVINAERAKKSRVPEERGLMELRARLALVCQ